MTPRRALALLALAVLLAAGAGVAIASSDHNDEKPVTILLAVPIGLAFVGSGLYAWLRRPGNRTGALMTAAGLLWFIGALTELDDPWAYSIGSALGLAPFIPLTWLFLAYPSGRLEAPAYRALVGLAAVLALFVQPLLLLVDPEATACDGCPRNALLVSDQETVARIAGVVGPALGLALLVATLAALARRWVRATPARRRALAPVYLAAAIFVVTFVGSIVVEATIDARDDVFAAAYFVALLGVPLAFVFGLLRSRLERTAAARLLVETPDEPSLEQAEASLRRVLHDPTVRLAYWDRERGVYLDVEGNTFDLPEDTATCVTTRIDYGERPVAALVHDAALRNEPELLEEVSAAVRVAVAKDQTLHELRTSEQRSRALVEAIPDNMFRVGRDGSYRGAQLNSPGSLPVPVEDLPHLNVREILPPDIAELVLAAIRRALDTGEIHTVEYRMDRPIGVRDSEARIVASGDDEAVIIVRDITDRKRSEAEVDRLRAELEARLEELETSERRNRALLDAIPDHMFRFSRDGRYLDVDTKRPEELAAPPEELVGLTVDDVLPPSLAERIRDAIGRTLDGALGESIEYDLERGGQLMTFEARAAPSREDEVVVIVRNVTARKQQEAELRRLYDELEARAEELQRERDYVRTVVNVAPSFFIVLDAYGGVVRFNDTLVHATGVVDDDETQGRPVWDVFVTPADADAWAEAFERASRGGDPVDLETRMAGVEGERVVAWRTTPIVDDQGQPRQLVTGSDVTERHNHAVELQEQHDFLNAIANNAPSLLCIVDETGRVAPYATNRAFERLLEYDPDETGGHLLWERYIHASDAAAVAERIARVVAGEELGEQDTRWVTSTGRVLDVAWTCTPLPKIDERTLFLVAGVDVTERKRQQEEIRASRARLVEAGDAERRRLERNLHDGAQQRLVSLSLAIRLARSRLNDDPPAADALLVRAADELSLALEELRELARGIHPAVLSDRGLAPALEALATRSPVPVEVEGPEERLPPPVEAAAFYVVSEALANVAKYAKASSVSVRVERSDAYAVVEVEDDGVGGADPLRGTGLRGLADRVAALDGKLDVESPPGAGTHIRARIPVG